MNLAEIGALARQFTPPERATLEKYLPLILAIFVAWLVARGFRKMFWTAFAMFWAFKGTFGFRFWF